MSSKAVPQRMIARQRPPGVWSRVLFHSLRTRLILAFLAATLIASLAVALLSQLSARAALTSGVYAMQRSQARSVALTVGNVLERQIEKLVTLGGGATLQAAVSEQNGAYGGDARAASAAAALDEQWAAARDDDELVRARLTSAVAGDLAAYQRAFPYNSEVILTDRYGGLVAASDRTSDYYQGDEEWWQRAWNGGQGAALIEQPSYDESTRTFAVAMIVPVKDQKLGTVIGVLRSDYKLDLMLQTVEGFTNGESGRADLLIGGGQIATSDGAGLRLDEASLAALRALAGEPGELRYRDVQRVVGVAPVTSSTGSAAVSDPGWSVVVYQDSSEAFQPLDAALRATILAAALALLLTGALGVLMAQLISRPILTLTGAARQLAAGDLSRRVVARQQDEIGTLSQSFNLMADSLEARIGAEQQAQMEARRLQEAEAAGRRALEETVALYLAFVQGLAGGNFTARLDVRQGGALGQLGEGLNQMVAQLRSITTQVQEASTSIAGAASEILAATTQQAAASAEQSAVMGQTSTTVQELNSLTEQTASQAESVARDGQRVVKRATQGARAVEETITGMAQIRGQVEGIALSIQELAARSQEIGVITMTVRELADQSNLLALNAAIEAARSGEQGTSFAVVARHMRELADRSKEATVRVHAILEQIQKATTAAVLATEAGIRGTEAGSRLATQAGEEIHRIAAEVDGGARANIQMALGVREALAGLAQVSQAVQASKEATTQAMASTHQTEQAAQDLNTLAVALQRAVATYRL